MKMIGRKRIVIFTICALLFPTKQVEAKAWWDKRGGAPVQEDDSSDSSSSDSDSSSESSSSDSERKILKPKRVNRGRSFEAMMADETVMKEEKIPEPRSEESLPSIGEDGQVSSRKGRNNSGSEYPEPRRERVGVKRRAFASLEDSSEVSSGDAGTTKTVTKVRRRRAGRSSDNTFRLGLLGGYTPVQIAGSDGSTSTGGILYFGLNADLRLKYFGVEVDGYYGSGSAGTVSSIKQMGGLFNIKGQITLRSGGVKWTPKLGVGYGYMSEEQGQDSVIAKSTIGGVFAVAGLEVAPTSWLTLSGDFARSVAGVTATQEIPGLTTSDDSAPAFQRIRVSAQFNVTQHFYLGANFINRAATWADVQPVNQVLATVGMQF